MGYQALEISRAFRVPDAAYDAKTVAICFLVAMAEIWNDRDSELPSSVRLQVVSPPEPCLRGGSSPNLIWQDKEGRQLDEEQKVWTRQQETGRAVQSVHA